VDERRAHTRLLACIPAYLESKRDEQDLALIRDVSVSGARLLTRTKLPTGVPIHLELYMGAEGAAPKLASGRVVRADRRAIAVSDVWSWEVGVEFDEPIAGYEREIEEISRHQEALGILKPSSRPPPPPSPGRDQ
jgi:hypothetical protein